MNELKSLSMVFQDRIFSIPDYQRGYAWEKDQILDLIGDLEDLKRIRFNQPGYKHFIGTLVLKAASDAQGKQKTERVSGKTWTCVEIVDGQQRLTTLVLFLNEISKFIQALGSERAKTGKNIENQYVRVEDERLWIFRLGSGLNEFFMQSIIGDGPPRAQVQSQERLLAAKMQIQDYIGSQIKSAEDPYSLLDNLSQLITDALGFLVYEVSGEHEVSVIFETMNSRGLGLTQFEKTKNLLFFICGRHADSERFSRVSLRINEVWAHILSELHNAKKDADQDQFLRYHWAIFPGSFWFQDNQPDRTPDIHKAIKESAKDSRFIADPTAWVEDYISSLFDYAPIYCDVVSPTRDGAFQDCGELIEEFIETCRSMDRIGRDANLTPLLMAAYYRYRASPDQLLTLFRLAESFSFRLLLQGRYASTGRNRAFVLAGEIAKKSDDVVKACEELRSSLIDYYCDDKAFSNAMMRSFNWYEWSGIRYLLFEYEQYRSQQTRNSLPIDWEKFKKMEKDQSIEHILPQGDPTLEIPYWKERFTEEQWIENRHTLGNLCICDFGANSVYKNYSFPAKCGRVPLGPDSGVDVEEGEQGKPLTKNYAISKFQTERDLVKYDSWTVASISERQKILTEFALNRWRR